MTEDFVTVPRAALIALVEYASGAKLFVDGAYVCYGDEQDASDKEFADLIEALGVEGINP